MYRKKLRSAFLKSGERLMDAEQRRKQAMADLALAQKTRRFIFGLRAADMPTGLGRAESQTWLPVYSCRTAEPEEAEREPDSAPISCSSSDCAGCCPAPVAGARPPKNGWPRIIEVSALIDPEIIKSQDRPQPLRTNPDGSTTWSSQPFPTDRLVEEVIQRYDEGRVEVGELAHAQTAPCRDCGQPALLVLEHFRDFDSDINNIRIVELCLECPAAHDRAFGMPVNARQSHPAFPFRKK